MSNAPVMLQVTVAWSTGPRSIGLAELTLPAGSTVAQALRGCEALAPLELEIPGEGSAADATLEPGGWRVGIWGKLQPLNAVLRDRDRIELLRGLRVDPKEARRQRYRKQDGKQSPAREARRSARKGGAEDPVADKGEDVAEG